MAGTADAWKTTLVAQNAGKLYRGMAVPGASARPTLFTDGTPDATANPSALHMGATKEKSSKVMVKPTLQKFKVDEFRGPILTNISDVEMGISAELVGVTDMQMAAYNLPGIGTRGTGSGYDYVTIGSKAIAYDCNIVIFPLIEDTTKYGWFQLYNCINDPGVTWAISRTDLGFTPLALVAYELTSRAAADTLGQFGKQI